MGSSFIDVLERFESDPETEYVVMEGEIGGDEEEKAAAFIEEKMSKPVVAYIAGFTAPLGKTMGHAGAIISGSSGTAQGKKEALEAKGIRSAPRRPRRPRSSPRSPRKGSLLGVPSLALAAELVVVPAVEAVWIGREHGEVAIGTSAQSRLPTSAYGRMQTSR